MVAVAIPPAVLTLSRTFPGFTTTQKVSQFPLAPIYYRDATGWLIQMAHVLNGSMNGRTNNTGFVTLSLSSDTTTVTLSPGRLGINTLVILVPLTASAATEFAAGSLYLSGRDVANNQFTLTHVNSAAGDRRFGFILVG